MSVTNISCMSQVKLKFINYTLLVNSGWLDFSNEILNAQSLLLLLLAYLKDSNAAAHSVDSDIFQSSDSSICALQDLTLTFIS